MIKLIHNHKVVTQVFLNDETLISVFTNKTIGQVIHELASQYPAEIICWCIEERENDIDFNYVERAFPHDRYLYSFNSIANYFPSSIGYVEESPYININKKVLYPTWQMSSEVGAIQSSTVLLIEKKMWLRMETLDYILSSIAKLYQPLGLFCYSNPLLLKKDFSNVAIQQKATNKEFFKFVREHYKQIWFFLLFINLLVYEKKNSFSTFLSSIFKKRKVVAENNLTFAKIDTSEIKWQEETIDVVIPTIGRKEYLYDVLRDLENANTFTKKCNYS